MPILRVKLEIAIFSSKYLVLILEIKLSDVRLSYIETCSQPDAIHNAFNPRVGIAMTIGQNVLMGG